MSDVNSNVIFAFHVLHRLFVFQPHSTVVPAKNICKMFAAFGTCFFAISLWPALFSGISFIPILTFWLKRKFNLNVQHFFYYAGKNC